MSGYAHIHRRLLGHPVFRNDAEAMAFAWLVIRASWKPTRVRYKNRIIALDRGQLAVSVRDFAVAMDRDKAWIERLLKRLKAEAMVKTSDETGVGVITICNYNDYQRTRDTGETLNGTREKTGARQAQDTEQEGEEVKKISSEPNGSGASADPVKEVFDLGVSVLVAAGKSESNARSLIGKWRKARSDGEVLTALLDCRARAISDPVEWIEKRFKPARYTSKSGYEYRGSLEQIEREAQRRCDNDTYWQIQVDKKQAVSHA